MMKTIALFVAIIFPTFIANFNLNASHLEFGTPLKDEFTSSLNAVYVKCNVPNNSLSKSGKDCKALFDFKIEDLENPYSPNNSYFSVAYPGTSSSNFAIVADELSKELGLTKAFNISKSDLLQLESMKFRNKDEYFTVIIDDIGILFDYENVARSRCYYSFRVKYKRKYALVTTKESPSRFSRRMYSIDEPNGEVCAKPALEAIKKQLNFLVQDEE